MVVLADSIIGDVLMGPVPWMVSEDSAAAEITEYPME